MDQEKRIEELQDIVLDLREKINEMEFRQDLLFHRTEVNEML